MVSDALEQAYKRTRWGLLLRGLIALALGILIVTRPIGSAAAFALVIAVWALVVGIAEVVEAIQLRDDLPHWWLMLIAGLVSAGFGVAALYYYPGLSLAFAVIWASYWLLVTGFFSIYISMQERRVHAAWGWPLAFGILSVLAGIYGIIVPRVTLAVILALIATFAIVGGILLLVGFFRLGAAKARVADAIGLRTS